MLIEIEELIKSEKYEEAEQNLLILLDLEEKQALIQGGVSPEPYEKLINLYWKIRNLDQKNKTIIRYLIQPKFRGKKPKEIYGKYIKSFNSFSEKDLQEMIYNGYLNTISKSKLRKGKIQCSACGKVGEYLIPNETSDFLGFCCAFCCESQTETIESTETDDVITTRTIKKVTKDKETKGCAQLFIVVVFLIVLFFWIIPATCSSSSNSASNKSASSSNKTTSSSSSDSYDRDKLDAWVETQLYVKQNLKSPSTASFGKVFRGDYQSAEDVVRSLGDGKYVINAWVDSQNDFGAVIRTYFHCELVHDYGGWKITSFYFK